jgi:hypothetical protein
VVPPFGTGSTQLIRLRNGSGNFAGIHHEVDGIGNAQNAPGSGTTMLFVKGKWHAPENSTNQIKKSGEIGAK